MSLYIDTYFILNLAVDYLILLATARLRAISIKRLRAGAAALFGAGYAVLGAVLQVSFLQNPLIVLSAAALMLLIAFGGSSGLLRTALAFAGVSAAFGGFALALARLTGGPRLDLGLLLIAFPACWLVLKLVFTRTAASGPGKAEVQIFHGGKSVQFSALGDSGNLLRDPVTGDGVLVAEASALAGLFDRETASLLNAGLEAAALLEKLPRGVRFRLVPYGTVGGSGLLPAFRPERVLVNGKARRDLLVAVAPGRVSDTGAFRAIIGGAL